MTIHDGDAIGDRVRHALVDGPILTRALLEKLDVPGDLDVVELLHRDGRSGGYGQCADGWWRLSSESPELASLYAENRPTEASESFFALRYTMDFEGWDADAPLLAYRSLVELENRHQVEIESNRATITRAIDYLLSTGLEHQEVEQLLFVADEPTTIEVDPLDRARRNAAAAAESLSRVKMQVMTSLLDQGLSIREVAARTGIPKTEVGRLAKWRAAG